MWLFIIFIIGMILFVALLFIARLHKFKGTKLKTRMNYSLVISLFLTLFYLWLTKWEITYILKGFLFGLILSIPFCLYSKRWIEKKIEGTTIFYKNKQYLRNLLLLIPCFVLLRISIDSDWGRQFLNTKWPMLGIAFSWLCSQIFILLYIVRLEKRLGRPILEDQK